MQKKKCIIYVRVSTEEQTKGYSLNAQENEDTVFAKNSGYEVIKVFREEGLSAKDLKRPVLQEMMKWGYENKGKFDAVVFWKWERISRGTEEDYVVLGKFFTTCGVKPLSVTECNDETAEGELLRWITKGINLYELRKISQRTALGMEQKAREGIRPGKAPLGYKNYTEPDGKKTIVVDFENAKFIKRAFELYSTGNYSFKRLGEVLYLDGFKTKTGEKYPPRKFEWMLKNGFYIGQLSYKGKIYEGKQEHIVSKELFYQVQAMFGHKKPKTHNIIFPYTNLIKCECCGKHNLSAEMKKGAHNSGEYIYYRCTCGCKAIKAEELEKRFAEMLEGIYIPPSEAELLKGEAKEILQIIKDYEDSLESPVEMQRKIEQIKDRLKKSYADKLDGNLPYGMTDREWGEMIKEWSSELNKIEMELEERREKSRILYDKLSLITAFCNQLPELFRIAEPQVKREIIQTCVRTLTYNGETLKIELFPLFNNLKSLKKVKYGADNGLISEPLKHIISVIDYEENRVIFQKIKRIIAA